MSNDIATDVKSPAVFDGKDDRFGLMSNSSPGMLVFQYRTPHQLTDILTPGYFDKARDWGLRRWHEIEVACGSENPAEATFARLVVDEVPGEKDKPITVALVRRDKATPARKARAE